MKFQGTLVSALTSFAWLTEATEQTGPYAVENQIGPIQIGGHFPKIISSGSDTEITPVVVVSEDGKESTYSLRHEEASYLSVHFENMDMPFGCQLTIQDGFGFQGYTMRGHGKFDLGHFWGHHVAGDSMDIILRCSSAYDSANNPALFKIDEYVAGYPIGEVEGYDWNGSSRNLRNEKMIPFAVHEKSRHLSICSADDKRNAICYKDSHPTEYNKARAVARLYINGSGACTGWLVSNSNLLFTNEHCIASLDDVLNTDFEFMGEEDVCTTTPGDGSWMSNRGDIFDGTALLALSATWDYALIQLAGNPSSTYGHLELDNRKPDVDETIYIPQHPGGRPKELGIIDTSADGGVCRVKGYGEGCAPENMRYTCDTEGGSSGSPVLSRDSNKVVALHHCGGGCSGNLGAPIYQFYNDISEYLVTCDSDSDCDDGIACTEDTCVNSSCSNVNVCPTATPTGQPTATPTGEPTFIACDTGLVRFELDLLTDNYGAETSWELRNDCDNDQLVLDGSGYSANTQYPIGKCVEEKKYTFTIKDTFGDGICCSYGTGHYKIYYKDELEKDGGDFGSSEETTFGSCGSVTTPNPTPSPTISPPTTSPPTTAEPTPNVTSGPTTSSPTTAQPVTSVPTPSPTDVQTPNPTPVSTTPPTNPTGRVPLEIRLMTDYWGHEVSFALTDKNGKQATVSSGLLKDSTMYVYNFMVSGGDGCHSFVVNDNMGDGVLYGTIEVFHNNTLVAEYSGGTHWVTWTATFGFGCDDGRSNVASVNPVPNRPVPNDA